MYCALIFQVKIAFEEPEPGVTIVNLTHTDIPEEDRLVSLTELMYVVVRLIKSLL